MESKGRILTNWSLVSRDRATCPIEFRTFNLHGYLACSHRKIITSPIIAILPEDGNLTVMTRGRRSYVLKEIEMNPGYKSLCPETWNQLVKIGKTTDF